MRANLCIEINQIATQWLLPMLRRSLNTMGMHQVVTLYCFYVKGIMWHFKCICIFAELSTQHFQNWKRHSKLLDINIHGRCLWDRRVGQSFLSFYFTEISNFRKWVRITWRIYWSLHNDFRVSIYASLSVAGGRPQSLFGCSSVSCSPHLS